jgi:hypothetical protein
MYERVLPVITPSQDDPGGLSLFHWDYGGKVFELTKIAENKWVAEAEVRYNAGQYMVFVVDRKVVKEYSEIARKISARIKGQEWIELTHITSTDDGEQAEFVLDASGIHAIF